MWVFFSATCSALVCSSSMWHVGEPPPCFSLHQPQMVPVAKAVVEQGTSVATCPIALWPAATGQGSGVSRVLLAVLCLEQPGHR